MHCPDQAWIVIFIYRPAPYWTVGKTRQVLHERRRLSDGEDDGAGDGNGVCQDAVCRCLAGQVDVGDAGEVVRDGALAILGGDEDLCELVCVT